MLKLFAVVLFTCKTMYNKTMDVTKTRNGEWGMGNGEWGMGNGEWGMRNSGQR